MNYTLHQLQVFLKVTQTLSITKASEELHLTQPAVSIQLKKFQDQFKIPLTEIVGRKLYVTDFGKEIALAAENIIKEANAIAHKSLAFKGELFGTLKLSVVSTGKYVIPFFLSEFLHKNSGVELQLDVTNKTRVVESLEKNEVDFSLVSILPPNMGVNRIELMPNTLVLVGNKEESNHPVKLRTKDINEMTMIYREPGSATRLAMENYFKKYEIQVKRKLELTSNEAVKQAILAGLGYSIMPLIGLKNEIQNHEIQIYDVKGLPITTRWNLIWLKDKKLSPQAQAFVDYLEKEKQEIIHHHFGWFENFLKSKWKK